MTAASGSAQPTAGSAQPTAGAIQAATAPLAELVGAALGVTCADGIERPYRDLDCAASTPAMRSVTDAVRDFLPLYSSVHRGAGYKSRRSTAAYEDARAAVLAFAGRAGGPAPDDDIAIICRNTTEALNHLAYRLRLGPDDVVLTSVVEHHANLLPWTRAAQVRWIECDDRGTFDLTDVVAAMDRGPAPAVVSLTGASNVTGWLPPVEEICLAAHERGIPVVLDAAQLAPHRPLPDGPDFVAFSGHKLYAPFGAGALIGPRASFESGDPFLAGGGAVDLVDLDEVLWTAPPEREEAGSPNVVGAIALAASLRELGRIGWAAIEAHERALSRRLRAGLASIEGVTLLGPPVGVETLAVGTFTVHGMHHALVAARLGVEFAIGVRHGCFCAHPYLLRLLGVGPDEQTAAREAVIGHDRRSIPGAVRASCGLGTTTDDVEALLEAVAELAAGAPPPIEYHQDPTTGDFEPVRPVTGWPGSGDGPGSPCAIG
ncbi:MAG TPA: aminotransferase class V-fold PLP-dependent enzyme [Acidimicrobiales bacterium]|jgi:selenocysteine lyase/cysteine desulfurase